MSNVNVSHEDARKFLEMLEGMSGNYTKLREQLEAKAYPEKIINLTPHDINLLDENNQVIKVFPCAKPHNVCTAEIDTTEIREVGGVPVHFRTCNNVYNLPDPEPKVFYIVSSIAAYCVGDTRNDLLTVSGQVRDASGRTIGVRRLVHMER